MPTHIYSPPFLWGEGVKGKVIITFFITFRYVHVNKNKLLILTISFGT